MRALKYVQSVSFRPDTFKQSNQSLIHSFVNDAKAAPFLIQDIQAFLQMIEEEEEVY